MSSTSRDCLVRLDRLAGLALVIVDAFLMGSGFGGSFKVGCCMLAPTDELESLRDLLI